MKICKKKLMPKKMMNYIKKNIKALKKRLILFIKNWILKKSLENFLK